MVASIALELGGKEFFRRIANKKKKPSPLRPGGGFFVPAHASAQAQGDRENAIARLNRPRTSALNPQRNPESIRLSGCRRAVPPFVSLSQRTPAPTSLDNASGGRRRTPGADIFPIFNLFEVTPLSDQCQSASGLGQSPVHRRSPCLLRVAVVLALRCRAQCG